MNESTCSSDMSLFIRVLNGFYTHRKTLRLRAAIGDAAFWVPPRLWAYASENQPDGCFSKYDPEELAMLVAYTGNAQALLQALLQAGFMDSDPLRIHDWEEHNGYHAGHADRVFKARKAASVRWEKFRASKSPTPPKTVQDKTRDPSIATSNATSNAHASCETPSWEEFWSYCQIVGMAAEWYAKDKFLAAEQEHWKRMSNWQAYASRCRVWWENDNRPMRPRTPNGNPASGQLRKPGTPIGPRPHVDAEWREAEMRWV